MGGSPLLRACLSASSKTGPHSSLTDGIAGLEVTLDAGAADLRQPADRLLTKAVCGRHQFPVGFPDAISHEGAIEISDFLGKLLSRKPVVKAIPINCAAFSSLKAAAPSVFEAGFRSLRIPR